MHFFSLFSPCCGLIFHIIHPIPFPLTLSLDSLAWEAFLSTKLKETVHEIFLSKNYPVLNRHTWIAVFSSCSNSLRLVVFLIDSPVILPLGSQPKLVQRNTRLCLDRWVPTLIPLHILFSSIPSLWLAENAGGSNPDGMIRRGWFRIWGVISDDPKYFFSFHFIPLLFKISGLQSISKVVNTLKFHNMYGLCG